MALETRCEACGRVLRPGEGSTAEAVVRVRGPLRRREHGAGYLPGEIRQETRPYRVCVVCARKIGDGASIAQIRGPRTAFWLLLFALVLVLVVILTPILLPYVRSALFLTDPRARTPAGT